MEPRSSSFAGLSSPAIGTRKPGMTIIKFGDRFCRSKPDLEHGCAGCAQGSLIVPDTHLILRLTTLQELFIRVGDTVTVLKAAGRHETTNV